MESSLEDTPPFFSNKPEFQVLFLGIRKKPRMLEAFALLYPDYIDLRTLLRLASTANPYRILCMDAFTYVAYRYCNVRWKSVARIPLHISSPPVASTPWLTMLEAARLSPCHIFRRKTEYFMASSPSPTIAHRQLKTKMCRECYRPTRQIPAVPTN